jgi:hypothetical protein
MAMASAVNVNVNVPVHVSMNMPVTATVTANLTMTVHGLQFYPMMPNPIAQQLKLAKTNQSGCKAVKMVSNVYAQSMSPDANKVTCKGMCAL